MTGRRVRGFVPASLVTTLLFPTSCAQPGPPQAASAAAPAREASAQGEDLGVRTVLDAARVVLDSIAPPGATRVRFSPDLRAVVYFLPDAKHDERRLAAWLRRKVGAGADEHWAAPVGPIVDDLLSVEGAPCWSADGSQLAISKAVLGVAINQMAIDVLVFDAEGRLAWTSRQRRSSQQAFSAGPVFGPEPGDVTVVLSEDATESWRYCRDDEPKLLFKTPGTSLEVPKAAWSSDRRTCCVRNNLGIWLAGLDGVARQVVRNEADIDARRRPWTAPQWRRDGREALVVVRGVAWSIDPDSGNATSLAVDGEVVAAVYLPDDSRRVVIARAVLGEKPSLSDAMQRGFETPPDRFRYFAAVFAADGTRVHDAPLLAAPDRVRQMDSRRELGMWDTLPWTFALLQQFAR